MTDTATITLYLRVELRAIVSWEIGLFRVEVTTRDGRLMHPCTPLRSDFGTQRYHDYGETATLQRYELPHE